jgi:hypothetical protein
VAKKNHPKKVFSVKISLFSAAFHSFLTTLHHQKISVKNKDYFPRPPPKISYFDGFLYCHITRASR